MQTKYKESVFCTQFIGYQRLIDVSSQITQKIILIQLPQLKQETRLLPTGIAMNTLIYSLGVKNNRPISIYQNIRLVPRLREKKRN